MSEMVWDLNELSELEELYEELSKESESVGTWANIGKATIKLQISRKDADGNWEDCNMKEYRIARNEKKSNANMTFALQVETTEFNEKAEKDFVTYIRIDAPKYKDDDDVWYDSNWKHVTEPSIVEVLNSKSTVRDFFELNGKYIDIRLAESNPTYRDPICQYKSPKLFQVFESREAAYAAYLDVTGKGEDSVAVSEVSNTWEPETWDTESFGPFEDSKQYIVDDTRLAPVVAKDWGITPADVVKIRS